MAVQLLQLSYHYPEAGHNTTTIELIAGDYFNDLYKLGMTQGQFLQVLAKARTECKYWPKVSDMAHLYRDVKREDEVKRNADRAQKLIEADQEWSQEDLDRNKRCGKYMQEAIAKGMPVDEMRKGMEEILGIEIKV